MSWGTKIFLSFVVFMGIIISLVVVSMRQDFYLVTDDYYKQEIEYQGQIDKMKNYKSLNEALAIQYEADKRVAMIQFPQKAQAQEGSIHFFRPSNGNFDFTVPVKANGQGVQEINLNDKVPGLWKVKINWTVEGQSFYEEKTLVL